MAALMSLSRKELQPLQIHSRSFSVNSLLIYPQLEQVFEDGSNLPILSIFLPYQLALYSSIETKADQLTSVIACAKLWFLSIPFTFKSSIAILSWFLISCVEVLCKKSLRLFVTFSCAKAKRYFVRLPLYFEYLHCTYFNFDCVLRKCLGFSNVLPSEDTKKDLIPKSIPTVVFSLTGFLVGIGILLSTNIEAKYFPVGVLFIVACLILPLNFLWRTILIPSLN